MITAKSWIDTGIASDVILLATDLCGVPQVLRAFSDLGAAILSRPPFEACRPFQEGSRGFVGGEAAVSMVLSGNAPGSYASVLGGAMTMDASNLVGVAPDLEELFRCFRLAIANAGADFDEVAYLNAHGPGTGRGDAAEAKVLDELLTRCARGLLGQTTGRALSVGRRRGGDSGHHLLLPDRVRPRSTPGGTGPSQAGRRAEPARARAGDQVLDRDGGLQHRRRDRRIRPTDQRQSWR